MSQELKYPEKRSNVITNSIIRNSKILSLRLSTGFLVFIFISLFSQDLYALDADNCLMCHRFRGLARVDKEGNYRSFYVDEDLFNRGPHARVGCKGCHADIEKIPHDDAKPVDCLRSCHIEEPSRKIIFTHEKVQKTLKDSVHALTDKDGAPRNNPLDYPDCKDCHDQPLFRPVSMFKTVRPGISDRAISRCLICHSDERFARYYYSHVSTRMHKSRDPREVVEMCSSCHSDPAFARRHNLSDVVSSYLETYHGKAMLFGSPFAPDCLDCHAGHNGVHEMYGATDPKSSVSLNNRAATCNSQDCHSAATPALASFDVHVTRDMSTHKLEFGVTMFFSVMILGVLMPILTLNMLGLLRELLPSHEAEMEIERLVKLAEKKAVREGGIRRFTGSYRVQHAFLVIVFVILSATGLPMKFPEASWAPAVYSLFGGIKGAPIVHRIAGVILLAGFVLHVGMIFINVTRALAREGKLSIGNWIKTVLALPMIPGPQDLRDIIALIKYVFFLSPRRPNYGRFSWNEKLEYFGLFWGIGLLGVTGALLWAESLSSHVIPGWLLNVCYLAHTYESILAVAHIALVHIPGVIGMLGPSPLSSMILNGKISPRAQAEEHGREIIDWSQTKGADPK